MKKAFCIVLSIAMLLVSFTACSKKIGEDSDVTTKLNDNGDAYINITNKNGEDVTDANGEVQTSVLSDKEKSKIDKKNNGTTTTTTTAGSLGSLSGIEDFNPNASPDDLLEEGTTVANKTTLREDIIGEALQNRKFTISTVILSEDGEMPATITMNGDQIATTLSMSGIDAKMIIKQGKTYVALSYPSKIYFELEDESFDMSGMTPNTEKHTYVGTTTVKDGDKTYTCEEYKTESGTTVKYYFLNNKWARYELIDGDTANILEITDFKGSVDESLFDLTGYSKLDLDSLANLGA